MQIKVYTVAFLAGLTVAGPCFDAWDCLLVRSMKKKIFYEY